MGFNHFGFPEKKRGGTSTLKKDTPQAAEYSCKSNMLPSRFEDTRFCKQLEMLDVLRRIRCS